MLFKTAIRNIFKYLRRSLVIFICLIVSIVALQVSDSISEGFKRQSKILMLESAGMILIERKGNDPFDLIQEGIKNFDEVERRIKSVIPDARVIPEIVAPAIVVNDTFSVNALVIGTRRESLISTKLAKKLKADAGDTIVILSTNRAGGLSIKEVKIESVLTNGLFTGGVDLCIPIEKMEEFLLWDTGEVKQIRVNFNQYEKADSLSKLLSGMFPDLNITPWNERLKNLESLFRISDIKMYLFSFVVLLLTSGIIMNSVLSSVMERKKDLGTIRAIGSSKKFIVFLILTEVVIITFFSCLAGTSFSYIITRKLMQVGFHYESVAEMTQYIPPVLYPAINPLRWIVDVIFLFVWAIIWSIYPAVLIARMPPVKALREEI